MWEQSDFSDGNYDRSLAMYLKEISRIPLLNYDRECSLARLIRTDDQEALRELTQANLRFVVSIAKNYRNRGLSLTDLINEGNIGLIRAAKRFDETRGYKFISYAVWWIKQAILQAIAEQSRIVRLPLNRAGTLYKIRQKSNQIRQEHGREATPEELSEELGLSVEQITSTMNFSGGHLSLDAPFNDEENNRSLMDIIADEENDTPDDMYITKAMKVDIRKMLSTLTAREAEVTSLYFGIDQEKPFTLEEIGQRLNLSRERVRQIKGKALERLRHVSRSRTLKTYYKE